MRLKSLLAVASLACVAWGHFGVVIPSNSTIDEPSQAKEIITYKFTHPFEGVMMSLDKPVEAGVFVGGKKELISNLSEKKDGKMSYYEAQYNIKEPGIYQFYMDPKPYFEPGENIFIRHITKTIVNAYGYGEGWDEPIGLKTEIIPLTRPYGLYKGNIFSGKVLYKGKPAKNTIVEVEYLNSKSLKAPGEDYITQEVKTNELGEFSFAMPLAGWWGFSALSEDDETIKQDGKEYTVEIGAVIWVETKDYE